MNGQRMPLADAIKLIYLVARGVGAAHSKGVVHRDLKPSNILITADGVPKVADFGLAKQLGPDPASISASVMGTPAYMAPEQAAGHNHRVGPQTDVYALGVILYQCLSGDVPLKGDSLLGMLETIRDVEPPNIRLARPDVPNELETIITRCLKKIPSDRYATADVLADELQKLAAQWGAIVRRTNAPIPDLKEEKKPEWEFPWKIPAIVGGAALMILIGLYLAGFFTKPAATKRDKGKPTEASGQSTNYNNQNQSSLR
jgi:serine/threonine protein kinase